MAKIKNSGDRRCWLGCGERGTLFQLLVGMQAGTTTLEISLVIPQKIGQSITCGASYTTSEHIHKICSLFVNPLSPLSAACMHMDV